MTRSVHTGVQTADATSTGPIDSTELEKRETRRVALRVMPGDSLTGDPEIALEVSIDGETWYEPVKETGQDLDILREVPEPYVRANVTTAADAGEVELWIAAAD